MRSKIYLRVSGFLFCSVLAQVQPGVAEILQKVSRTYKGASSFELAADVTPLKVEKHQVGHVLFAFQSPGRYRLEMVDGGDAKSTKVIVVHDGSTLWMYSSATGEYVSNPSAPRESGLEPQDPFLMWRFRGAGDFVDGAKLLREETIEAGGAKVDCYVVTLSPVKDGAKSTYTWWVDKQRSLVVRDDGADSSSVYTMIKLAEPLADDLFRFDPPPGSRKAGK